MSFPRRRESILSWIPVFPSMKLRINTGIIKQVKIFQIFFLALCIRLICLYIFKNITNYDLQSYLQVGELTLKGINIYPEIANLHHPYLPFFLYFEAFSIWFGKSKFMSVVILKLINLLFDIGVLYLVYLLSKKNLISTFIYAVNPVTILITTLHGQFDVIPIFFLLLSIYFLNKNRGLVSILFFSLSILIKTWPILFFIPILRKIKNKKIIPLILLLPIIFISIYIWLFKSNLIYITKTVIYYQGLWGIWGISILFRKIGVFWQKTSTFLFLISFFGYSLLTKSINIIKRIYALLIFFFVFTTNFSIQYFAWFIPFLILIKPKKYLYLIFLISIYLFSFYSIWLFNFKNEIVLRLLTIAQDFIGFILWISFVKKLYLSKKIY